MKTLKVVVKKEYKSFIPQEINFEGDFIILTGVNGSGKSHFFGLVKEFDENNNDLYSQVFLDSHNVSKSKILLKSFKDVIVNKQITQANNTYYTAIKDTIWQIIQKMRNFNNIPNRQSKLLNDHAYGNALEIIFSRLGKNYSLTRIEFDSKIDSFEDIVDIWQPNDFFNEINLSDLFLSYTQKRQKYLSENNGERVHLKNDFEKQNIPPWKRINITLEKMGFEYRFADDYETTTGNEIKGGVRLLNKNGDILPYDIGDLSDGEKIIFSLALASLRAELSGEKIKILLLDEYDAPLNPSLTQTFFEILKDYFIDKNILVILSTHSTDTLMLAPEFVNLYQVNKKDDSRGRFILLDKMKYEEYKIVHDKHVNDEENFRKLYEKISQESADSNKLRILTEGKNTEYIQKAIELLDNDLKEKVLICTGFEDRTGAQDLKRLFELFSTTNGFFGKTLFVWDCDQKTNMNNLVENESIFKFIFEENLDNNKVKKGIENLFNKDLFEDSFYTQKSITDNYGAVQNTSEFNKTQFTKFIIERNSKDDFLKFQSLVDKVKQITNN